MFRLHEFSTRLPTTTKPSVANAAIPKCTPASTAEKPRRIGANTSSKIDRRGIDDDDAADEYPYAPRRDDAADAERAA